MQVGFDFYRSIVKPTFDFGLALLVLLVLSPLLIFISLLLLFQFKGSPIYIQQRVGHLEKRFDLYKFRTYRVDHDRRSISRTGRLLRASSMDELPQLFNILKGEMSWIGPRPLLPEYLSFYTENERIRHLVKPGISGLSQIKWGNTDQWDERLRTDVFYVQHQSFLMDVKLVLKTLVSVLAVRKKQRSDKEIVRLDELRKHHD